MKWLEDNFIALYCTILVAISCLFLGAEIQNMKHDAEVRHNQKIINNCNAVIARNLYE